MKVKMKINHAIGLAALGTMLVLPWMAKEARADAVYPHSISASYDSYTSPKTNTVEVCYTIAREDVVGVAFNYCVAKDDLPSNWSNEKELSTQVMCARAPKYGRNPGIGVQKPADQRGSHCITSTARGAIPALRPHRYIFSITSLAWQDSSAKGKERHHDWGAHAAFKLVELEAPSSD